MNGRPWSRTDLAKLKRQYPDKPTAKLAVSLRRPVYSIYNKAFVLGLKKSEAYRASPVAGWLRRGDNPGIPYRFKKGHVPFNKGRKGWQAGGRSAETRFQKGHRPQTWVPIGTEVVDPDGYRKRKVRDDAPLGFSRRNWKFLHVLLWEEAYGPVPRGYAVIFINGTRADVRLDNLALVSRAELMRLNTIHNYPPEVKQVIRLVGKLNRVIEKRAA